MLIKFSNNTESNINVSTNVQMFEFLVSPANQHMSIAYFNLFIFKSHLI